jgi:UDP-glucose 4-epimerase
MTENVLVTGVAGFIGAHVARHCVARGMRVIGLDDLSGGFSENVPDAVRFVRGSILDQALIARLFDEHRFDYVYHLAAYAAEGLSHFVRRFNYTNNLVGSMSLINESVRHDVQCFVFTSSIAVYGASQTPMREELAPRPEDPYGIAKYAVELDLAAAHHVFGLRYVIFRPHNVYGELQNIADAHRNVIGIFANQVMQDQPMTIFGDGSQTRAFSHVDDVAPLIADAPRVPQAYGQTFNIGADEPHTVLALAHEIARAFGVAPRVVHLPARSEVGHAFCQHDKLAAVFSRRAPISLREGVARTVRWAKERGPVPSVAFKDIELRKGLPPSWDV